MSVPALLKEKFKSPVWLIFVAITGVYFFSRELFGISDFQIFFEAATNYKQGVNPYTTLYGLGFRYYYSPLFALVLAPFTYVDAQVVGWIWKLANLFFLYKTIVLIEEMRGEQPRHKYFYLFFFLGSFYMFYTNLHNLQMTIFLVWAILVALKKTMEGKYVMPGVLLALIVNFKIIPIVLIPWLVIRKKFKVLAVFGVAFMFFLLLPSIYTGWKVNAQYHKDWWALINPVKKEHNVDLSEKALSSISSLVPAYLMNSSDLDDHFSFKRHVMELSPKAISWIVNILRLVLIASFLLVLRAPLFQQVKNKNHALFEVAYILFVAFLVFPHQQTYGFFLGFILLYLIFYGLFHSVEKIPVYVWVLLGLACISLNSPFYLGDFRYLFYYLKIPTFGYLMFFLFVKKIVPKPIE